MLSKSGSRALLVRFLLLALLTLGVSAWGAKAAADPPVAVDDVATAPAARAPFLIDLSANDSDADGDPLGYTIVEAPLLEDPAAPMVDNGDGTFTYTPGPAFTAGSPDTLVYQVSDGRGGTAQATVELRASQLDPGGALELDGDTGEVVVAENPQLAIGDGDFTVEAWIHPYHEPGTNAGRIVNKQGEFLLFLDDGTIELRLGGTSTWETGVHVPAHHWSHVAVSVTADFERTVYLNGIEAFVQPPSGTPVDQTSSLNDLIIGGGSACLDSGLCPRFRGMIDDVGLWDRALTGSEIRSRLLDGLRGDEPGLVGFWAFEETSGTTAIGQGSAAADGALQGGIRRVRSSRAPASRALQPSRKKNAYVSVPASPDLELGDTGTIELWVLVHRWVPNDEFFYLFTKPGEFQLALNSGRLRWAVANSVPGWQWVETGFELPIHIWTHVAWVYDHGAVETFVNGELVHSYAGSGAIGDVDPADDFMIGNHPAHATELEGVLDDVRLWNIALSPQEIRARMDRRLSGSEPGLIAAWEFEEEQGTVALDVRGAHHGALVGDSDGSNFYIPVRIFRGPSRGRAYWAPGDFSSPTTYIDVGPDPAFDLDDDFTLELWVFHDESETAMLVSREGEYWLAIINGRLHWAFANSSPGWNSIDTGYTVRDDRWHHLAVTYSAGVIKSYGDGRLVHTYNGSGTVGDTIDWMNNFLIGHREWGVENDWATQLHGFLDEVRVWGRVLTEAEIQAGMNRHLRGDEPGLIAYWSFDEPEGVAVDRAGGHDGTWIGVGQRSWTPSPFELSR